MKYFYCVLLCVFVGFSCRESARTRSVLEELVGSEIAVPAGLLVTVDGKDTVMSETLQPDAKMVVWYDSVGCSSCRINRMEEWSEMLTYGEALRGRFQTVFVLAPKVKELKSVRISLMGSNLGYPVLIDTTSAFTKANPLVPNDSRFHTFLLDKNNQIILAGSPLDSEALLKLYKKTIKTLVNNGGKMPE